MSTLEKTIHLMNTLPENQIETIYSFVQFLCTQCHTYSSIDDEPLDDIFEKIVGAIPDTGKTLEEYREERIKERYADYIVTTNQKDYSDALIPVLTPMVCIEKMDSI